MSVWKSLKVFMKLWQYLLIKKTTRSESNRTVLSRNKRVEAASSNTQPAKYGSSGKRCKQHVDHSKSASKTCMIHGVGHSSDECKILGKFGDNYAAAQSTKDQGRDPISRKRYHKKKRTILLLTTWWMNSAWFNPKS